MSLQPAVLCSSLCLLSCLLSAAPTTGRVTATVLSSRPDMVSGNDALIEIKNAQNLRVTVNGRDVSYHFHADAARGSMIGLVDGLRVGANTLIAKSGSATTKLQLVNHPTTGPIVSGEHLKPYFCNTEESGLGKSVDTDCTAPMKVEYFYRSNETAAGSFKPLASPKGARPADLVQTTTSDGKTVPYIVRVESGTINRAIYHIAILDDAGWNHRIIYSFGGGCGSNYTQGKSPAINALFDPALSRGFAHITSTQNVMQQHCNDNLSAEAVMMIKEHFIKSYGIPTWTMGFGGSGGAIQQLLIAQNFPGLLDGLLPSLTFPDSTSIRPDVSDCRLMNKFFATDAKTWTKDKQTAVAGYSPGTCNAWDRSFADTIVAANVKGCGIAPELVYDPVKNPKGVRCTTWDTNVATYGRDPATGFARQAMDNIGVQYGLKALNSGQIGKQEFIDLNRGIGGYDRDGVRRDERSIADLEALKMAYVAGRVNSGGGALGSIPMLHYRSYNDALGDIHDHVRDFVVRERLRKANGGFANQVIWVYPNGNRQIAAKVTGLAIDTMTQWLDSRVKPAAAIDGCWTADGTRIDEPATLDGPGKCNQLYPSHSTPRLTAGAPLTDDIMKCQLKPVDAADYTVKFTAAELQQLRQVFPGGVCDYSKPGVMQLPLAGTYLVLPLSEQAAATH
jgi:Tannase-like family of unknown function (DUF6351)